MLQAFMFRIALLYRVWRIASIKKAPDECSTGAFVGLLKL